MKRIKRILIFLSLSLLLVACKNIYIEEGIRVEVMDVDQESKTLFVKGLDEKSIVGDKSYISCSEAEIKKMEKSGYKEVEFSQIKVGDVLTMEVGAIMESYPTQTSARKILIEQ